MSNAGRFQLLEQGQLLLPGKCISCGTVSIDRKYVDLEISVDFFGQIYFCTECFAAIAYDLNWVRQSDFEDLNTRLDGILEGLERLRRENEALKNVLAIVFANKFSDVDDIRMYTDKLLFDVLDAKASTNSSLFIPKQYEGSDESSGLEGSDDLRSDAADSFDSSDSGNDSSDDE